jgi:WbqC-like protein family
MSQPVLPLCAFPPVHWFQSALSAPSFIVDTTENYPKQTCRNRYDILGANGKLSLTIPIVGQKGQKVPTSEILIHQEPWRKSHWISLQSAYKRSAYFEHYEDIIKHVFSTQTEKLVDFNLLALKAVSKALKLETNYTFASTYLTKEEIGADADFRDDFEPSFLPKSQTPYLQVFSDRFAFQPSLSILDLLFNLGPKTVDHILLIKNSKV